MADMRRKRLTKAYVLSSGAVVKAEEFEPVAASKRIIGDPFKDHYEQYGLVMPPYDFYVLTRLMVTNTYHARAVHQKASDVAGRGWSIVSATDNADAANKRILDDFFSSPNDEQTFRELITNLWTDYEGTANGYLEVARNLKGHPSGLWHVPAHTMRVHASRDKYAQIRGNKIVWFKRWGLEQDILAENGQPAPEGTPVDALANEIIHFKKYNSVSDYYGVPEWIPSAQAMATLNSIGSFNRAFFDSNGVPQYVIVIQGAELDEELEAQIASFFRERVRGEERGTLLLPIPFDAEEVKIHFEKLAVETKDGSFLELQRDYIDEILVAHGVPPYRIGIVREGSLGGSVAEETTEIYKSSIVEPGQETLEHRLNACLVRDGFNIEDWKLKFNDIEMFDEQRKAEKYKNLSDYVRINEVRREFGLDPIPGGDQIILKHGQLVTTVEALLEQTKEMHLAGRAGQREEGDGGQNGRRFRALPGGAAGSV